MTEHPPELTAHLNVCPSCGTVDSGHAMDPPCICPHPYDLYEPVVFTSGHLVISREDAQAIVDASEGFTTTSNAALDRLAALLEGRTDG